MSLWKPLDQQNIKDPYPMYRALREEAPVYRAQTGEWILTRYADIKTVLTGKQFLSGNRLNWIKRESDYLINKGIDLKYIIKAMDKFVLQLDPPSHTHLRKFISENWKNRDVEEIIKNNIDQAIGHLPTGRVDLHEQFTSQLPSMNATAILGLPQADYKYLHELASHMIIALDLYVSLQDLVKLNDASREFINYFESLIKEKNYGEGLLANLVEANEKSTSPLNTSELTSLAIFIFVAGEETSVSFTSTGMYHLLKNDLTHKASKVDNFDQVVDELLRYDPPVQLLGRLAGEDTQIGDSHISKNDTLTLAIAAANRDPEIFSHPDEIDFNRTEKRHFGFGQGIHYCLGDWLAKISARLAFKSCIEKFPRMQLIDQSPNWNRNLAIRSLKSLWVDTGAKF